MNQVVCILQRELGDLHSTLDRKYVLGVPGFSPEKTRSGDGRGSWGSVTKGQGGNAADGRCGCHQEGHPPPEARPNVRAAMDPCLDLQMLTL